MKVMQINSVYKKGSTGKIVFDIHKVLQEVGVKSMVCYGRGKKTNEPYVYKTSSELLSKFNALRARVTGLQYNGSWISTGMLLHIIKREQPDIVHLQCINGNFVNIYRLLNFLKRRKISTVLTLHAEFMYTGSCGHAYECTKWKSGCGTCPQLKSATKSYWLDLTHVAWLRMKKSLYGFEKLKIVAVSGWLQGRAKRAPLLNQYAIEVIHNGIDTNIFKPVNYGHLKDKYNLKTEKILLHVTASFTLSKNDAKGGHFIVEMAERLKDQDIKILVIGGRDLSIQLPSNVLNIGRARDQEELAAFYTMADLTVLTSRRETFSMVCAESLSCGTPVVGFKAGGPETISIPEFSEFVDYGNVNLLTDKVNKWIHKKSKFGERVSNKARHQYSSDLMGSKYLDIYEQLLVE